MPTPRVTLHILRGRASQKSREMAGPTLLIGSDARCDVQMRSPHVAARHCLISRRDGKVLATRLSAEHPVLLNGAAAAEEELKDRDVLGVGPFELRVEFSDGSGEPVAPTPTVTPAEPPAVHRPRFALLDRKPAAKPVLAAEPQPAVESVPTPAPVAETPAPDEAAEQLVREREALEQAVRHHDLQAQELQTKDARLQEWARRLEAQEVEVERGRAELEETLKECEGRRKTLADRRARLAALRAGRRAQRREQQSRFANLLGEAERRAKDLDAREGEVESREERCRRLTEELDARQSAVDAQERQAAAALADLDRRREALQRERGMLDREWQRLFARQQDVADHQAALDRRTERVAAEEALLGEARTRTQAELRTLQQLNERAAAKSADLEVRTVKARGRERALDERARQLADAGQSLAGRESELNLQAADLRRRAAEAHEQLETQQRSIDERRAALEADLHRHEEEKQALQDRQAVWKAEVASLSQAKEELDRRTSLLAARERALSELEAKGHDPAELDRRYKELRREQDKLAAEAVEAAGRRRKLDAETAKLAEIAAELEARQRELSAREQQLADSAAREHEALGREAERLQQEQAALDARAEEQRRRWERLKASAVRFGSRRKVLLERLSDLETRFQECKREIAALVDSRRRLRASLEEFAAQAERREREALEWLRGVRAESDAAAEAHRRFTRQFDVAVGAAAPTSLRASLGDWSNRLTKLQRRLSTGEAVLKTSPDPTGAAAEMAPVLDSERDDAPAVIPLPTLESKATSPGPATAPVPPKWLFKLVELGLADEEVLTYLLVNARERKVAVEEVLVEQGVVTPYQIECVGQGRHGDLRLGPATVLERLHAGTIATTYRVMVPPFDKAVALRLLHPQALTSDAAKAAFLEHVQATMRFRHPSAASILGPFQHEGRVGVLTEFAAGQPLPLAAAAMTPGEVVACFRQCLAALFAGQRAGFVHRSLRPSRIVVSSLGRIVLLGFGEPDWLIKMHRCERGPAADYYVAPEDRAGGRPVDTRADLFSLCRIFLEVLLARRPSPGESIVAPPGYPDSLLELLIRGVQGDPAARCRSFAEVIHQVDRWLAEGLPAAAPAARSVASRAA